MGVVVIKERIVENHPAIDEEDAQYAAGDEFAELDDPPCITPSGLHDFNTCCGETKCRYCCLVVWS